MSEIHIADYDPQWPMEFENLASRVRRILDGLIVAVEHVGSTSVPGLAAKPIIDFDVVIADRAVLPKVIAALESVGYRYEGDLGIAGREAFRSPEGEKRHHLYVCDQNSPELRQHLAFRDYLRTHPQERDRYVQLKRRLAAQHRSDREAYAVGKVNYVSQILTKTRSPE